MNELLSLASKKGESLLLPKYADRIPILGMSLVMGAILAFYGYRGGLIEGATYEDFLIIGWMYCVISFAVLSYLSRRTRLLDKKTSWSVNFYQRAVLQLYHCWILPTALVYFVFLGLSLVLPFQLRESTFLYIDIYIVAMLLLLINAGYVIAYYDYYSASLKNEQIRLLELSLEEVNKRQLAHRKEVVAYKNDIQLLKEELFRREIAFNAELQLTEQTAREAEQSKQGVYLLRLGRGVRRIPYGNIVMFFMREGTPWLRQLDGEEYMATEKTLAEVREVVIEGFFLVKRSYFINENAVKRCVRREGGRIVLFLKGQQKTMVEGPSKWDEALEQRILSFMDIEEEGLL